jgi:hypothetical protein
MLGLMVQKLPGFPKRGFLDERTETDRSTPWPMRCRTSQGTWLSSTGAMTQRLRIRSASCRPAPSADSAGSDGVRLPCRVPGADYLAATRQVPARQGPPVRPCGEGGGSWPRSDDRRARPHHPGVVSIIPTGRWSAEWRSPRRWTPPKHYRVIGLAGRPPWQGDAISRFLAAGACAAYSEDCNYSYCML